MPGGATSHQVGSGLPCAVPTGQCGCFPAIRWSAVHVCSCGAVDGHVQIQVQVDAADPNVQGPQACHILSFQHCKPLQDDGRGAN